MITRSGEIVSAQVGVLKPIEGLSTANFKSDVPFQLKNDGDEDVYLEVNCWSMPEGEFTKTRFPGGGTWSPEIIREIKKDATLVDAELLWGH